MVNNNHTKLLVTFSGITESKTMTCLPEIQPPRENINNKTDFYHQFKTLSIRDLRKCI